MFYASVFFCWVAFSGNQCLVAHDTEGPYLTRKECEQRVKEIEYKILQKFPYSKLKANDCTQQKEGRV